MSTEELIDLIYQVEEDCGDLAQGKKETTQEALFRIDELIEDLRRDIKRFERAKALYEHLNEMGLEKREDVSDFIFSYGLALIAADPDKTKEAMGYFEIASDYGGVKAKIGYAKALIYGTYGIRSPEEGLAILRGLAEAKVADACYLLYLLRDELPGLIEGAEAKEQYERAGKLGYAPAFKPLPADYDVQPYTEKLLYLYEKGDTKVCYELSKRPDLPEEKKNEFLIKAAENGDPLAEEELAFALKEAGEPGDAKGLFLEAAKNGRPQNYLYAADLLGLTPHFYEADEITDSGKEEFALYEKAAAADVPAALAKMAIALGKGVYVKKDPKAAVALLRKAMELGDLFEAPYLLAEAYRTGEGVKQDIAAALPLYEKAARRGNVLAMLALAKLYEEGAPGLSADPSAAARYRYMSGIGRD